MPTYGKNVCDLEFNCISTPSLIPKAKQCTSQKKPYNFIYEENTLD